MLSHPHTQYYPLSFALVEVCCFLFHNDSHALATYDEKTTSEVFAFFLNCGLIWVNFQVWRDAWPYSWDELRQ